MSTILFTEQPLVVNRELATIIGLNEAIIIQQVDFFLKGNKAKKHNFHDGRFWTYNTYKDWQEKEFPFLSFRTIERTFKSLEKDGFLIAGNYNKFKVDKTKWYTIDYDFLDKFVNEYRIRQNGGKLEINDSEPKEDEDPRHEATRQNGGLQTAKMADTTRQDGATNTKDSFKDSTKTLNTNWEVDENRYENSFFKKYDEERKQANQQNENESNLPLIKIQDVKILMKKKIEEKQITDKELIESILSVASQCTAIGTTYYETAEKFVDSVIKKHSAGYRNGKVQQKTYNKRIIKSDAQVFSDDDIAYLKGEKRESVNEPVKSDMLDELEEFLKNM